MRKIFTIFALISISASLFAQAPNGNDTCTNGTLSINLNTPKTVYHKVNTAYTPMSAEAISTVYSPSQVSLTKISDVNPNIVGIYTDCYTATDPDNLKVECCRMVVVQKDTSTASIPLNLESNIVVFPNPVISKRVNIQLGNSFNNGNTTIQLIDLTGKVILNSESVDSKNGLIQIMLNDDFSKGLYLLVIKHPNGVVAKRISIE